MPAGVLTISGDTTDAVQGIADVGYFVFLDLGGYVNFVPGTLMTIFSATAITTSFVDRRTPTTRNHQPRISRRADRPPPGQNPPHCRRYAGVEYAVSLANNHERSVVIGMGYFYDLEPIDSDEVARIAGVHR